MKEDQKSLVDYDPQGHKQSETTDTTERVHTKSPCGWSCITLNLQMRNRFREVKKLAQNYSVAHWVSTKGDCASPGT